MYTVLGSLYLDEITLEPIEVVPTLATATLFQLEGIIEQCAEIMVETVNAEVCSFSSLLVRVISVLVPRNHDT